MASNIEKVVFGDSPEDEQIYREWLAAWNGAKPTIMFSYHYDCPLEAQQASFLPCSGSLCGCGSSSIPGNGTESGIHSVYSIPSGTLNDGSFTHYQGESGNPFANFTSTEVKVGWAELEEVSGICVFPYSAYLTFRNIDIPSNATINKAILKLRAKNTVPGASGHSFKIAGHCSNNSDNPFVIDPYTQWYTTSENVIWPIHGWSSGVQYSSTNFSNVIRQIFSLGWSGGNNLTLFVSPDNQPTTDTQLPAFDYSDNSGNAAKLEIWWTGQSSGIIPLYTRGHIVSSGSLDLYLRSTESSSGNLDLYAYGVGSSSGNLDLYAFGESETSGFLNLYTISTLPSSGQLDLYSEGSLPFSGGIDLYTYGVETATRGITLFTEGWGDSSSGVLPLYVWATTNSGLRSPLDLYALAESFDHRNVLPLYTKGPTSTSFSGSLSLYLWNDNRAYGSLDLYVKNDYQIASGYLPLYVITPPGTEGYIPASAVLPLFISRDTESLAVVLPLYTRGPTSFSGEALSLYAYGGYSGITQAINLYSSGYGTLTRVLELFSLGY